MIEKANVHLAQQAPELHFIETDFRDTVLR